MPGLRPTKAFTGVTLELATIRAGQRFGRIYHERYPDPLGFGKTKSRFSDSRRRPEDERFGVLYLGFTLKGCFVEAILRDRRERGGLETIRSGRQNFSSAVMPRSS
jgi:hypothetical protein